MKHFDSGRKDFSPYGLTCEIWEPRRMPRVDRHNEIELNLLEDGALTYLMWGRRVTVRAGSLAAFWAAIPHQVVDFEGASRYYVVTAPLASFLSWDLPRALTATLLAGDLVEEADPARAALDRALLTQWHADLRGHGHEEWVLLELKARLLRLAANSVRKGVGRAEEQRSPGAGEIGKVEAMAAFVALHYRKPIRVPDVARSVDLHPDYASALYRSVFGVGLGRSIVQHRVLHAERMLVTTDAKVLTVALASGFHSLSRFNAAFKAHCRCTPVEYRRRHRVAP